MPRHRTGNRYATATFPGTDPLYVRKEANGDQAEGARYFTLHLRCDDDAESADCTAGVHARLETAAAGLSQPASSARWPCP